MVLSCYVFYCVDLCWVGLSCFGCFGSCCVASVCVFNLGYTVWVCLVLRYLKFAWSVGFWFVLSCVDLCCFAQCCIVVLCCVALSCFVLCCFVLCFVSVVCAVLVWLS